MFIVVLISILSGTTSVIARTVNAKLADSTTLLTSTLLNYVTGLIGSTLVFLVICLFHPYSSLGGAALWMYSGGVIGIVFISLCNATVSRISSFSMTLLSFIGQVFTGILIDAMLSGQFSIGNLIGGIIVSIGLIINVTADKG